MATYSFGSFLSPPGVNGGTTGFFRFATMGPPNIDTAQMSDTWNLTTSGVDTFSVRIVGELTTAIATPYPTKLLSLPATSIPGATLISVNPRSIGYTYGSGYLSGDDITIGGFNGDYSGGNVIEAVYRVTGPSIQIPLSGYSWNYNPNGPRVAVGDSINYSISVNYLTSSSTPPSQDDYSDSLADTSSPKGSLVVNGTATGTLESIGDHDWFSVQLTSGQTYVIDMRGSPSGGGTLSDAYLRFHNSAGTLLVGDDDAGVGEDSQLIVSVTTGGTFYVNAGAYNDEHAGTYTVGIRVLGTSRASTDLGTRGADWRVAGVGDFDGDGTSDIMWQNTRTGALDDWKMLNGNWAKSTDLGSRGPEWRVAGVGDFDRDGTSNILWQNTNTGAVDEWRMKDGNWAGSVPLGSRGADWIVAGVGDFNGDRTVDILWRNAVTGQLDDWQMANGNWARSVDLGSRTPDWQIAGIADLNGDGTDDILWRNPTTGRLDDWQMNNGNWSRSVDLGSRTPDWQIVGLGDFVSGDNNADIMWRNSSGQTDIWKIVNGNWAGSSSLGSQNTSYQPAGVGDLNRSGLDDVLWRDGSGHVIAWLL